MAYSEKLAGRIRKALAGRRGVTEKKMFGGIGFMVNGNMACGVRQERLVLRLGAELAAKASRRKHAGYFDFTGKPVKTMIVVEPGGIKTAAALKEWTAQAVDFARALPKK